MAISANTRKLNELQNLVLYVDIRFSNDGERLDSILSEIHEEDPKRIINNYPLLPTSNNPILHSYGKRLTEWQATLAFLDVLYGQNPQKGYRAALESRLLSVKDRRPLAYTLCLKIRHEGKLQDPSLAKSWLAQFLTTAAPPLVPPSGTVQNAIQNLKENINVLQPLERE